MRGRTDFFTLMLLAFIFFIGMIRYIFNMSGWPFYIELVILLGLMFFAFISAILIYNKISFGYTLFAIVSAVALLNLVIIYFRSSMSTLLFASIIASMTAFVVSVVSIGTKKHKAPEEKEQPVIKTYTPGKVVSSKTAKYYHIPNCDWAKRIKKSNQVWYDSDLEAKEEGLEPHDCVK